jgi:hypothetical protein
MFDGIKHFIPIQMRRPLWPIRAKLDPYFRRLKGFEQLPPLETELTDYVRQFPGRWRGVLPARRMALQPSRPTGSRSIDFQQYISPDIPERGVLEIPRGGVLDRDGLVLTREGGMLADRTFLPRERQIWTFDKTWRRVIRRRGVALSLVSEYAWQNYAHFLLESLTRLDLFKKAGYHFDDVDHVLCTLPFPGMERLLDRLGVPSSKCVHAKPEEIFRPDTLILPSQTGKYGFPTPETVEFLRRNFQEPDKTPWRKIYIQRQNSRKIVNEEALSPALRDFGFEVYRLCNEAEEQHRIFSEARVVVGVHGADMANLAFCAPGTRILEISPTDFHRPYFYHLAESAGMEHYHLVGDSVDHRKPGIYGGSPYDVTVNPDEFREALHLICRV